MQSKKAIKNILVSLILQIVTILCGFIVPKLIISNFGSNVNGLVTSITQFLIYVTLLEAGVGPVVKAALFKPISKNNKSEIASILKASENFFKKIAFIFLGYILVLCFIYPIFINSEFSALFTISLILIISLSTMAQYFFSITYRIYLSSLQENYVISSVQIGVTILNTIFILLFVYLGLNIQLVKLISAIIFVCKPLILCYYVKKKYPVDFKLADNNYKLKQKWDGLAQHVANIVQENTDIVVLSIFTTMADVSVYSVYYLVIKGIKSLVEALTSGIDSFFGDIIAKDEINKLNKNFSLYEFIYFSIISIIYICTLFLITPFIKVYTLGINDANYIQPLFGVLITISGFVLGFRLPYALLISAAGHFKETKNGAWIEAVINIFVSILLVNIFGLIGVAIGTIISVSIRTLELMFHASKCILKRKNIFSFRWIIILITETFFLLTLNTLIFKNIEINSYLSWIIYALIIFLINTSLVLITNLILNKNIVYDLIHFIKQLKNRKEVKKNV